MWFSSICTSSLWQWVRMHRRLLSHVVLLNSNDADWNSLRRRVSSWISLVMSFWDWVTHWHLRCLCMNCTCCECWWFYRSSFAFSTRSNFCYETCGCIQSSLFSCWRIGTFSWSHLTCTEARSVAKVCYLSWIEMSSFRVSEWSECHTFRCLSSRTTISWLQFSSCWRCTVVLTMYCFLTFFRRIRFRMAIRNVL